MTRQRSPLFLPLLTGIILLGVITIYKLSASPSSDSARAATFGHEADTAAQTVRPAPDFTLTDINGVVHHLSDYRGKVVILNFWATWCPPCRKELPDFVEIQKAMADQGVQFLGIALDDEGLDKVKPWVVSHGIPYPIMIPDHDGKVAASYGEMSSIPVTYFIDRKGMIRASFVGMRQRAVVEKELAPLVAEK